VEACRALASYEQLEVATQLLARWKTLPERVRAEANSLALAKFPGENPNPVLRVDVQGRLLYANAAARRLLGTTEDRPEARLPEAWRVLTRQAWSNRAVIQAEIPQGDRHLSITLSPLPEDGYVYLYALDITQRIRAEEQVKASLAEKEMLLREIYHRVKNNLQVVSSLLSLQGFRIKDPKVRGLIEDCKDRIMAMSLVHDNLCHSSTLATIDLGAYIARVGESLIRSQAGLAQRVDLLVEAEGVEVNTDTAMPLGLAINELLTNCFKYAFPEQARGTIWAQARRLADEEVELLVADDGVGLPPGFALEEASSLGLKIVKDLVELQLGGSLNLLPGPGARFQMVIPASPR